MIHKRNATGAGGEVYIGRPSRWGNPYQIGRDGTRDEVIAKYRNTLREEDVAALKALNPTRLVCWCAPRACHGDVLADAVAASEL